MEQQTLTEEWPRAREETAGEAHRKPRFSLLAKGMLAFGLLVAYVVGVGFLVAHERTNLMRSVQALEQIHTVEERLAKVNTAVAHAVLNLQALYYAADAAERSYQDASIAIEAVRAGLAGLVDHAPQLASRMASLERDLEALRVSSARSPLLQLRLGLHELVAQLDQFTRGIRDRKDALSQQYRRAYDAITLNAIVGGSLGVLLFGGLVMLFFSRLVWDVNKVRGRARDIVAGYRGTALDVDRKDEVGELMESVNRMQHELRQHEQRLEITRRQSFHQEKMAALGSLAAAVAHEINNPIAAISGVAETIHNVRCSPECANVSAPCHPELIFEQTRRITKITRQLSEMAAPASPEAQLIDVNAIVRNVCSFMSYDKRFRHVGLKVEADPQLPAFFGVADHITQVLMNLLINAADAMEGLDRRHEVTVATRSEGSELVLIVSDNGAGMDAATRARAFEEAFTTKPAGKGSGLGLFLCRSLIEEMGGHISLESERGVGTRVTIGLPLGASGG